MHFRSCLISRLGLAALAGAALLVGLNATTWSRQQLDRQLAPLINNSTRPPVTDQCSACHQEICDHYQETGHARSLSSGTDPRIIDRFANLEYRWSTAGPVYRYVVDDEGLWLTQDGSSLRLRTDWVMGSGGHSQGAVQLITSPTGDTEMLEHILAWYPDVGLAPALGNDERRVIPDGLSALSVRQEHANTRDCLGCHSTHVEIDAVGKVHSDAVIKGVGCVRCHDEAAAHVANQGSVAVFRERWSQHSPRQVIDRCGECHRRAYEFDSRDIHTEQRNIVRFAPVGLSQSRCFKNQPDPETASSDLRLDCLSCHDIHRPLSKSRIVVRQVCQSCHGNEASFAPACPSQPATSDCVSCHMPVIQTDPNLRFTDHWIRIRRQ